MSVHRRAHRGTGPPRPRHDPFHDEPHGLADLAPGSVIRSRRVVLAFLGVVPQRRLRAWQVAYRSTDLHGRPEVAVTTVVLPRRPGAGRPRGVIGYQCAIDAVSDRCLPSYAMRLGSRARGALPPFELVLVAELVRRGHVVSIADHGGRSGSFAAPREPGHRVLDGIRAVLSLPGLGLDPAPPVGLIGYSGGGMATAWAAEMAPTHAPELRLAGAAMGSPVGDPGEAFIKLNGTRFAGLPAMVVAGLRHVYPGLADVVRRHAHADGLRRLQALEEMTTMTAIRRHRHDDFDDFLDAPLADVLGTREILQVFDDLRLGNRAPSCPLLVVQATHDQVVDVRDVDAQVERYLDGGAHVRYLRDRLSEHNSLAVLAFPTMVSWLEERIAADGAGPTGTEDVVLALSPRAWRGLARTAATLLRTATGRTC